MKVLAIIFAAILAAFAIAALDHIAREFSASGECQRAFPGRPERVAQCERNFKKGNPQ